MADDRLNSPTISQYEKDLRIQILDYLFERGHKVSKPLIDATASFTYEYGQALYQQGIIKGKDLVSPTTNSSEENRTRKKNLQHVDNSSEDKGEK
jgi:hypothetical protein